jgi:hypothetical protein
MNWTKGSLAVSTGGAPVTGAFNGLTVIPLSIANLSTLPITGFRASVSCDGSCALVGRRAIDITRIEPGTCEMIELGVMLKGSGTAALKMEQCSWFDPALGGMMKGDVRFEIPCQLVAPTVSSPPTPLDPFQIFLSYRRRETAYLTNHLYEKLADEFGPGAIIKDDHSIPAGGNFESYLMTVIPRCQLVLAVIGAHWLEGIDEPDHWPGREIDAAMKANVEIFPVLDEGASMPREADLPLSLHPFAKCNALWIRSGKDFNHDMDRLLVAVKERFPHYFRA